MQTADYYISKLGLETHIEGGYFKEIYRNPVQTADYENSFGIEGERSLATTIYFLLKSGQVSKFHKLKFDEIWFFHFGCTMIIHTIDNKGNYSQLKLGLNIEMNEKPQVLIPANTIFGAEPEENNSFSLVSCMVSPGFDFRDFKLYSEKELCDLYPKHNGIIKKLSR